MSIKKHIIFLLVFVWPSLLMAEETDVSPEIVLDTPPPESINAEQQQSFETETVTIYESKFLPGVRPCTEEDNRGQATKPVACRDEIVSKELATRNNNYRSSDLIVDDDAVPQGNIFNLQFERFRRKKQQ